MNKVLFDQLKKGNYELTPGGVMLPVLQAKLGGVWSVQKNDGPIEYQHNVVTTEGATAMLDIMFHGATQILTWYVGLYEGVFTPLVSHGASDIVATFDEWINYDNATRPAWDEAAASAGSITDNTVANFVSSADTQTVTGAFLVSVSAKSAITGTCFSVANFSSAKALDTNDELNVGYTLTAQDESV